MPKSITDTFYNGKMAKFNQLFFLYIFLSFFFYKLFFFLSFETDQKTTKITSKTPQNTPTTKKIQPEKFFVQDSCGREPNKVHDAKKIKTKKF